MFPDIDTNDGGMSQERILVSSGHDLETSGWAQSLTTMSLFQQQIDDWQKKRTSHPQPEPWIPAVVVLNSFLRFSRLPNRESIASFKGPGFKVPPLPLFWEAGGAKFFQNKEWLMCPKGTIQNER